MERVSSRRRAWAVGLLAGALGQPAAAEFLRSTPGAATAISGDGRVVFGAPSSSSTGHAFRWEHPYGTELPYGAELPYGPNPEFLTSSLLRAPKAASFDGSVFVGDEFRWEGSAAELEDLAARDVSASGAVVVGEIRGTFPRQAFRWESGVAATLAPPAGMEGAGCVASAISADGVVIAGTCGGQAVRWMNGVPAALGPAMAVHGISADGATLVGDLADPEHPLDPAAFVWKDGVFTPLGRLPDAYESSAIAVSADGRVVVGASPRGFDGRDDVFVWSEAEGMRALRSLLAPRVADADSFLLAEATGISEDGLYVVGKEAYSGGWVAYIGTDADNDGVLDADDLFPDDPEEFADRDGDGFGDNGDAFPDDASEWSDLDRDGAGDHGDPDPSDPTVPMRAQTVPGDLLVAAGDEGLIRLEPFTGHLAWLAWQPGFAPTETVVGPSGIVYALDGTDGKLYRVDAATGVPTFVAGGLHGKLGLDDVERPLVFADDAVVRIDPATGAAERLFEGHAYPYVRGSPFGDVFGVTPSGYGSGDLVDRLNLRSERAKNLGESIGDLARSIVIIIGPSYYYSDVAVGSGAELVLLGDPLLQTLTLSLFDAVARQWTLVGAPLPDEVNSFDPWRVATDPGGALFVVGWMDRWPLASGIAVLELDRQGGAPRMVRFEERPYEDQYSRWSLAVVPGPKPAHAPAECTRALSGHLPASARVRMKGSLRCVDGYAREGDSAVTCLDELDSAPSAAARKTLAAESALCGSAGTGSAAVTAASKDAVDGLVAALFGDDLDASLAPRASAGPSAKCQLAVAKVATRCLTAHLDAFERCRKGWLDTHARFGPEAFDLCTSADAARVARACDPEKGALARRVLPKQCRAVDLGLAFPGCQDAGAADLAACVGENAACLACGAEQALHGAGGGCPACP